MYIAYECVGYAVHDDYASALPLYLLARVHNKLLWTLAVSLSHMASQTYQNHIAFKLTYASFK